MAHQHNNSVYSRLIDRLNQFPQGAPLSDTLFKILRILFSEQEAGLVAQLPITPVTVTHAAAIWKVDLRSAQKTLETLAGRAILLDIEQNGEQVYCLPPPMAGFFEFALMRVRGDIDQKALSELFYQYLNVEEDFVRDLFVNNATPLGRIFVQEAVMMPQQALYVLDYERASHIINTAHHIGISMCYCRHKQSHVGAACDAPMDICMTFNNAAASLIKHGYARQVDVAECTDLLHKAQACNLVQFGENTQEGVNFICNCCGCCCEALLAIKRFAIAQTIHSNYLACIDTTCIGCGKCAKLCPMDAISLSADGTVSVCEADASSVNGALYAEGKAPRKAQCLTERCIGCGVCVRSCPTASIRMEERPERTITPVNTVHRIVLMATQRGTLKELLQNNSALMHYRIMGAVIGAIAKQPGPLRDFAVRQLKSRYMERIMRRIDV